MFTVWYKRRVGLQLISLFRTAVQGQIFMTHLLKFYKGLKLYIIKGMVV